ncbi:MAG: hypothetical protein FWD98_09385, partial [Defluviitaleaceae bacterium]|nr:hypothetical protein [Defluviitaleaceae bacterium]
ASGGFSSDFFARLGSGKRREPLWFASLTLTTYGGKSTENTPKAGFQTRPNSFKICSSASRPIPVPANAVVGNIPISTIIHSTIDVIFHLIVFLI